MLYGCRRHNVRTPAIMQPHVDAALSELKEHTDKYERSQWVVFTFHECRVLEDTVEVVGEILAVLAQRVPPYGAWGYDGILDDRCAAAMADAGCRVGSIRWMAFMQLIDGAVASDGFASRGRVDFALTECGWRQSDCAAAWKVALHHDVVSAQEDGTFVRGELFVPVAYSAGMVP